MAKAKTNMWIGNKYYPYNSLLPDGKGVEKSTPPPVVATGTKYTEEQLKKMNKQQQIEIMERIGISFPVVVGMKVDENTGESVEDKRYKSSLTEAEKIQIIMDNQ